MIGLRLSVVGLQKQTSFDGSLLEVSKLDLAVKSVVVKSLTNVHYAHYTRYSSMTATRLLRQGRKIRQLTQDLVTSKYFYRCGFEISF